jgi:hypothetical protein
MSDAMHKVNEILVTGDVIIEWRFAQSRMKHIDGPLIDPYFYMHVTPEAAGAVLLGKIILTALDGLEPAPGRERPNVTAPLAESFADLYHIQGNTGFWKSYILCSQQKATHDDDATVTQWRVRQRLGIDRTRPRWAFESGQSEDEEALRHASLRALDIPDGGKADLIVVEQSKQGFFGDEESDPDERGIQSLLDTMPFEIWPASLSGKKLADGAKSDAWLLAEWTHPNLKKKTAFWRYLTGEESTAPINFRDRIVVVLTIEDLRLSGLKISRGLSWEQSVEDLCSELRRIRQTTAELGQHDPFLGCRYLIVSFNNIAAVLLTFDQPWSAKLFYRPDVIETFYEETYPGEMTGTTRCLTAGLAIDMARNGAPSGLGIGAGIIAAHRLWLKGFDAAEIPDSRRKDAGTKILHFPTDEIAAVIRVICSQEIKFKDGAIFNCAKENSKNSEGSSTDERERWSLEQASKLAQVTIPTSLVEGDVGSSGVPWSILRHLYCDRKGALDLARKIVTDGERIPDLVHLPVLRVGKLIAMERKEIEGLQALRTLLRNYLSSTTSEKKPISIAVFGDPGSGKSFAINQLTESLYKERGLGDVRSLNFNVSQFATSDPLKAALQLVQDASSRGGVPLVFWDEFDTALGEVPYGWLRYFLAPMQDGQFQEGSLVHSVGRAIFVFAGSTCPNREKFYKKVESARLYSQVQESPGGEEQKNERGSERLASSKISDFYSRLKGYLDIPSLNYDGAGKEGSYDPAVMLRRAILLREFLKQSAATELNQVVPDGKGGAIDRFNVDSGVIDAFLMVKKYRFGVRSMEAIIRMSAVRAKDRFDRSSLPPDDQLGLHVEAEEFLRLVSDSETPLES